MTKNSEERRWPYPLVVFLATCAAFSPALKNGLLGWDDEAHLIVNTAYQGLGWTNIKWMFTTSFLGNYQPLSWLTYAVDYSLWGTDPFGFHLTNLLLHAASAVLFYFVSLRLLSPAKRLGAAAAALLFSLHPLRVESVVWASERRDVLSSFFYLATILLWLRAVQGRDKPDRRRAFLSWCCYLLALLSKSMTVTLPAALVILDVYPLRRLPGDPRRWTDKAYRALWLEKLFFLVPALLFAGWAVVSQSRSGATVAPAGWADRIAVPAFGLAFYLWKTVWPFALCPLYERSAAFDPLAWPFLLSGAAVAALAAGLWSLRRRWPAGLAALAYYAFTLAPVSGLIPFGRQLAADRYTYLPCLVWPLLAAAGLLRLPQRAALAALAAVLAALFGLTWRQTKIWRDPETFWRYVVATRPRTAAAHYDLANILFKQGKKTEAVAGYRETLAIDPGYPHAEYNLANTLAEQGESEEALLHFRKAAQGGADAASAHYNLAGLLLERGETDAAVAEYLETLKLRPDDPDAHYNLANALLGQGRPEEAVAHYLAAVSAKPDFANAHYNLGVALLGRDKPDEAIPHFREALRSNPRYADAENNWGNALVRQGKLEEAARHYRQALAIDPRNAAARNNLGFILGR